MNYKGRFGGRPYSLKDSSSVEPKWSTLSAIHLRDA